MRITTVIKTHLTGFRSIGVAFTIFTLANITIYLLISLHSQLLDFLYLSTDHPWGILTSAFAHIDLAHLVNNLEGFTFAVLLFLPVVSVYQVRIRRRWSRVFLWLVFLSGICANAIEYPLYLFSSREPSLGASGIVYGALGVLLAASLLSLPAHIHALAKGRRARRRIKWRPFRYDRYSRASFSALMCFSIILSFLYLIITDTAGFLSAGPGVDVLAHGLGFLLGFLPAMVLLRPTSRRFLKSRK